MDIGRARSKKNDPEKERIFSEFLEVGHERKPMSRRPAMSEITIWLPEGSVRRDDALGIQREGNDNRQWMRIRANALCRNAHGLDHTTA